MTDTYTPSPDDAVFNATAPSGVGPTKPKIKTATRLMGNGAKIQLCPSGDCAHGQTIMLSMTRLEEFDTTTKPYIQAAKNFNALSAKWSAFEPVTVGGIQAITSSFVATFSVAKATTNTTFNLTTMIYQANGTAMNGNQSINVPAGALKFSAMITNWPFKSPANQLRFGNLLKAQGKKGANPGATKKNPKVGKTHMDRVDMGQGMYMDAPTLAVVDNVTTAITSSIGAQGQATELVWVFPSFTKSVYYDPVMGSEDPSASVTTTTATNTGSTTGTSTTGTGSLGVSTMDREWLD